MRLTNTKYYIVVKWNDNDTWLPLLKLQVFCLLHVFTSRNHRNPIKPTEVAVINLFKNL